MAQKWSYHYSSGLHELYSAPNLASQPRLVDNHVADRGVTDEEMMIIEQASEYAPDAHLTIERDPVGRIRLTLRYPSGK
jgi:hypothetical protein